MPVDKYGEFLVPPTDFISVYDGWHSIWYKALRGAPFSKCTEPYTLKCTGRFLLIKLQVFLPVHNSVHPYGYFLYCQEVVFRLNLANSI